MSLTRTNVSLYPGAIDTDAQLEHIIDNVTEIEAKHFNNIKDAIIAIETTIGSSSTLQTIDLNTQLSDVEGGFFLKEGDVMWGNLNFKHQDLNKSTVPARLFFGHCNCVIGLDDREFMPGDVSLSTDGTAYATYSPDVGSKFIPTTQDIRDGVITDGVVPLSIVGSSHVFTADSESGEVDWENRTVSLSIDQHVGFQHRVRMLDDVEVTGSLRVRNFLAVRGIKEYNPTDEFGNVLSNTIADGPFDNENWWRHSQYSAKTVIVGVDSVEPPTPANTLSSEFTNLLVTKGARIGKLFGGEFGIQFLGAKFWKTWQDMDFVAEQVVGDRLSDDDIDSLISNDTQRDSMLAQRYKPGSHSPEMLSMLSSPLQVEIPYDTCLFRDRGIDNINENSRIRSEANVLASSAELGHNPIGFDLTTSEFGQQVSSKYKMFWVNVTCETEDPSSLVLMVGRRSSIDAPDATSPINPRGMRYTPVHQAYMERRQKGKENICVFSFLINPGALQDFTVRSINEIGRGQLRPRYAPYSVGSGDDGRRDGLTFDNSVAINYMPHGLSDYGYLEPAIGEHICSYMMPNGLSPTIRQLATRPLNVSTKSSRSSLSPAEIDDDGTPLDGVINSFTHSISAPSNEILQDLQRKTNAFTTFQNTEHNVYSFTLRRHRSNKPYPITYESENGHLPIAEEILDYLDTDVNGWNNPGSDDDNRREEIDNLFYEGMPEIKNILITIFAIDDLPNGQDSIDFDPGSILFTEITGSLTENVMLGTPKAYRWASATDDALSDSLHGVDKLRLSPRQFIGYSYFADTLNDQYTEDRNDPRAMRYDYRKIVRY